MSGSEVSLARSSREAMRAAGVRVDEVIWLPGASLAEDGVNDGLALLAERFPKRANDPLIVALPQLRPFVGGDLVEDDAARERLADALKDLPGFIVWAVAAWWYYLAWNRPAQSWGQSWGAWLYAASEAEIAPTVVAWADDRHADNYILSKEKRGWRAPGEP